MSPPTYTKPDSGAVNIQPAQGNSYKGAYMNKSNAEQTHANLIKGGAQGINMLGNQSEGTANATKMLLEQSKVNQSTDIKKGGKRTRRKRSKKKKRKSIRKKHKR
jgi:hypothetical protein